MLLGRIFVTTTQYRNSTVVTSTFTCGLKPVAGDENMQAMAHILIRVRLCTVSAVIYAMNADWCLRSHTKLKMSKPSLRRSTSFSNVGVFDHKLKKKMVSLEMFMFAVFMRSPVFVNCATNDPSVFCLLRCASHPFQHGVALLLLDLHLQIGRRLKST